MSSGPLRPDAQLDVRLSAICSRNRHAVDPAPVIAELTATAREHTNLLAEEAGTWAGFYENDHTRTLALALREIPGAAEWAQLGRDRRNAPTHSTDGLTRR